MDLLTQLSRRMTWRLAAFWLVMLGGAWLFIEFADEVYEGNGLPFDEPILTWFEGMQGPTLTRLMYALSVVGDVPATLALAAVALAGLTIWIRREILFFVASIGGAAAIMLATKYLLARPRPDLFPESILYVTSSPSFPSGHATGSAAFYLTLYLIARRQAPQWSWLMGAFGAVMAAGIAISRIYLQVHYPSDVLAGLALGVAWVLGSHTLLHRNRTHRYLVLRLPRDLAEGVHDEAARRQVDEDDVVAEALADRYPEHGGASGGRSA